MRLGSALLGIVLACCCAASLAAEPNLQELQRRLDEAKRQKAASAAAASAAAERLPARLVVSSDAPCQLSLNERSQGTLAADTPRAFSLPKGNVVVACQGAEPEARYAATHALEPGGRRVVAIELRDKLLALQRRREAAAQPAETRRPYDDRRASPPATLPPVVVADAGWPRIRAALEARRGRRTLRDALSVLLDVNERAEAETVSQFDAMMRRLPYSSAVAMGSGRNGLLAYGWTSKQRSPYFANEQALANCTQRGAQCVVVMANGSLQEGAFETVARQLGSRDPAAVREAALRAFRQTIGSGY